MGIAFSILIQVSNPGYQGIRGNPNSSKDFDRYRPIQWGWKSESRVGVVFN